MFLKNLRLVKLFVSEIHLSNFLNTRSERRKYISNNTHPRPFSCLVTKRKKGPERPTQEGDAPDFTGSTLFGNTPYYKQIISHAVVA